MERGSKTLACIDRYDEQSDQDDDYDRVPAAASVASPIASPIAPPVLVALVRFGLRLGSYEFARPGYSKGKVHSLLPKRCAPPNLQRRIESLLKLDRLHDSTFCLACLTAVQISWAEQRRLLKTREKASPKGCSGDQVAALDKIEIMLLSQFTAVQISWAEQRRLLKTREKASPKGCSGDQVAALDKIEIMLLSQLGLHSRQ